MRVTAKEFSLFIFSMVLNVNIIAAAPNLFDQIKHLDEKFFKAFNECDIETIASMFSRDLEFYHDVAGLGDYESNMDATKGLCSRNLGLVRTLLPESLEVYPIKGFGAMQLGKHTFCHEVNGVDDCGTFGFLHVWKQSESGWSLHRVMSYGH